MVRVTEWNYTHNVRHKISSYKHWAPFEFCHQQNWNMYQVVENLVYGGDDIRKILPCLSYMTSALWHVIENTGWGKFNFSLMITHSKSTHIEKKKNSWSLKRFIINTLSWAVSTSIFNEIWQFFNQVESLHVKFPLHLTKSSWGIIKTFFEPLLYWVDLYFHQIYQMHPVFFPKIRLLLMQQIFLAWEPIWVCFYSHKGSL